MNEQVLIASRSCDDWSILYATLNFLPYVAILVFSKVSDNEFLLINDNINIPDKETYIIGSHIRYFQADQLLQFQLRVSKGPSPY